MVRCLGGFALSVHSLVKVCWCEGVVAYNGLIYVMCWCEGVVAYDGLIYVTCLCEGVVAYNGLIYVIGGDDGSSNLSSVECYNPKTDTWTLLTTSLAIGRSYAGVSVIDRPI